MRTVIFERLTQMTETNSGQEGSEKLKIEKDATTEKTIQS